MNLFHSLDGIYWELVVAIGWGTVIADIVTNGTICGVVVAVDSEYRIYWTADFSTWTQSIVTLGAGITKIAHDGSVFVITSRDGATNVQRIYTSPDLVNFTLCKHVTEDSFVVDLIAKNGVIAAMKRGSGSSTSYLFHLPSPYSGSWVDDYNQDGAFGSNNPSLFHDCGDGRIFIFGRGNGHNGYAWSDDLINWSGVEAPWTSASEVAFLYSGSYRSAIKNTGAVKQIMFSGAQETEYSPNGSSIYGKTCAVTANGAILLATSSGLYRSTDGVNFVSNGSMGITLQKIIFG